MTIKSSMAITNNVSIIHLTARGGNQIWENTAL